MTIPIRTNPTSGSKPAHAASDNLLLAIANTDEPNGRVGHHTLPLDHHDAAEPPVVHMNPPTEERRGGRSRQDHSRTHKGNTKFGDFILGNTIGEGEFGKVKLGWKQDSSVQVWIGWLVIPPTARLQRD
jgi:protein-serine/threonine kinase